MTTQYLLSQIDEEVCMKLNEYVLESKMSRDCIVNEALKHYLAGRVASPADSHSDRTVEKSRAFVLK